MGKYKTIALVAINGILILGYSYWLTSHPIEVACLTLTTILVTSYCLHHLLHLTHPYTFSNTDQGATYKNVERRLDCRHRISHQQYSALSQRTRLSDVLQQTIQQSQANKNRFAVMLIHLDVLNHHSENKIDNICRDALLLIQSIIKPDDITAYINDNELVVIIKQLDKQKLAGNIAQLIVDQISRPQMRHGKSYLLKPTIGIAIYPTDGTTLEAMIENAQNALYRAKTTHGQLIQFSQPTNTANLIDSHTIKNLFKQALNSNDINITYQPIFDLSFGNVSTVQSLLRWEHPTLGIINPNTFIDTADQCGLLSTLTEKMLHLICQHHLKWKNDGHGELNVIIKLSESQLFLPTLTSILNHTIMHSSIDATRIHLSIPENTLMKNIDTTIKILNDIKSTGVTLGIDHFGAHYTSLYHLHQLPITYIVMDKSILNRIENKQDNTLVKSVILLGKSLGFRVIAEGVESANQLDYLVRHQCDAAIGYLLSYPVTADKITCHFDKINQATEIS